MRQVSKAALVVGLIFGGAVATAKDVPADQRADDLVEWAPRWRVGDWWLVCAYQREIDLVSGELVRGEGNAPEGFAPSNRLLFQVDRRELVRYPGDAPSAEPEAFLVVTVRGLDGLRNQSAELFYTEEDMSLAKVVTASRGQAKVLTGTAQLRLASSGTLGVPLEWPDFHAAARREALVRSHGAQRVRQQVKTLGKGRVRIKLQPHTRRGAKVAKRQPPQVLFDFQEGRPSWSRVQTRDRYAELVRFGSERDLPKRYRK